MSFGLLNNSWTSKLLESVTRFGLHIDYVIMYLCNEEDKDNKIYFWYAYYRSIDFFLMCIRDLSSGHKCTN